MKSQMTIGKKLFTSVGALIALTLLIGVYAWVSMSTLGGNMEKLVNVNGKGRVIAGEINSASSELVSLERGILLRAFMNDRNTMEQYRQDRVATAQKVYGALSEISTLSDRADLKQMISEGRSAMERGDAIHAQVWQLATTGKLDAAISLQKNSLNPELKKISEIAQRLMDDESATMAKSYADAASSVSASRWIDLCVMGLVLVIGLIVVWMIRQISEALRKIVTALSNGGEQVASASGEIAATSQSLSQGSSEQAASLEQISASMEQMTAMAKRNSENSTEATGMMNETAKQVDRSNVVLGEMVISMSAIKTSSEKVAKIIKTIDEIAFQTNILALNAAVEAARAGEAGMGFAVVADEVRNLAQRSAVAAKDTAGLIEEAISNSNQGAEKLDQVAVSIRAITESANKVKGLVEEVSESSKQQTIGINQTSTAVTQVSKVTQTAAASAEESAAASEELSAQAKTMRDLVQSLSGMVDGDLGSELLIRDMRAPSTVPLRHKVTRPSVKNFSPSVARLEEDPFPMDSSEVGNFRSF